MIAKPFATDALKTNSIIQKTAETTGDLIGNKTSDTITKSYDGKITVVSKNSQQKNSETVTNEHNKEIPKERYVSLEKRQKIIDNLRLI